MSQTHNFTSVQSFQVFAFIDPGEDSVTLTDTFVVLSPHVVVRIVLRNFVCVQVGTGVLSFLP